MTPCPTTFPRSLNERGLYDYLLINDDLQDTLNKLTLIAQRALDGQPPEPGMVPERVVLEDVSDLVQLNPVCAALSLHCGWSGSVW